MIRDVFYYGQKPNVHPKEKLAKNLADARKQATTEHFWIINEFCDYRNFDWDFDFDFLPDHEVWTEQHINVWPSVHQKDSGTWLCPKKFSDVVVYRCDVDKVKRKKNISNNWKILENIDTNQWDFSWHPDPTDPPYVYKWGCKFFPVELKSCIEYHVEGATNIKYMSNIVELLPNWELIKTYHNIDYSKFDMSWRPSPLDPPLIYVWGNKFVDGTTAPTIEYYVPGATEKKYLPELITLLPHKEKFEHLENSDGIDYTWIPNPSSPPYIYAWGNQWNKPEDKISIQYVVEGATEYKYMSEQAIRKPCLDNWIVPDNIDTTGFDFSWEPSPADPAYIYQFGTQWQKTGGPRYVVEGATEVKYIDIQKAKALPTTANWTIPKNLDITGFDFSWHPDDTSPPYVYHFATQWALTGGPIYTCEGANEVKYLEEPSAIALPDRTNWEFDAKTIDVDNFDFSWHPYVEDQPYVYVFGTQHQKTGGPKYVTPGALSTSPVKYIDTRIIKATRLSNKKKFSILNNYKIKDFDYSWHPDETDEPYIYVFGNNQYPAEIMPTIEYAMPGAKQIKYVNDVVATLDTDMKNWKVPKDVDTTGFDFSWKPNPKDPPYIYQFGTQHQKTGGPRYEVPGATEIKYIATHHVTRLPNKKKFKVLDNLVIENFDYSWHPDETDGAYIYVFGNNQYPAEIMPTIEYRMKGATQIKYVNNVVAKLGSDKKQWVIPKNVDTSGFDFSWKPNPKDPPLIYQFGTQHQKTGGPKYIVKDATAIKYIDTIKVVALSNKKNFAVLNNYKIKDFDYSWHPDETDGAYIYQFGNNQYPAEIMPTIEYAMPGATQVKYVSSIVATLNVDMTNWQVPADIDTTNFDFSWKPNPKDPPYIYQFGTQHQKTGGPRYVVEGATEVKYVSTQHAIALASRKNWTIPPYVDVTNFDFSWHPDDTSPPYTYHFATQWALTGGPIYKMEGATEVKYLDSPSAVALPNREHWEIPADIDATSFDFSWHPYVEDQPYIYQFGTQHQKTGGPRYVTPGVIPTSPIKYIDTRILKAKKLPSKRKFSILNNYKIKDFDYSWHPDDTDEPYIYVFGNNQYPAEIMPTIEYAMPGAKQIKYISNVVATLDVDMSNWVIPKNINTNGFDFSWKPNPKDPPYIYQFGTQHQKTGGPRYVVEGATEVKYVTTQQVKALPSKDNWTIPPYVDVTNFDFSWHPDDTSPPYIYHFATQWALTGGPIYKMEGATEVKYLEEPSAIALPNKDNWEIPDDIDIANFDFSWHPYVEDQPYIYQFGTEHQKTGGPKYITPGVIPTSPIKYIDTRILKAKKLVNKKKFSILNNYKIKDFDFSWHPDDTDGPYIYVFGNNQYPAEIMPTIEYAMPGAAQVKYVADVIATLDVDMSNWIIPKDIDTTNFDFSWKPNPKDPAYIYEFGTHHQKTGGPRYVVEGATEVKYVSTQHVVKLPNKNNFVILDNLVIDNFDYSWHPDDTDGLYIYVFGNNQYPAEIMPTIEYRMPGATQIKYVNTVVAELGIDKKNWIVPDNVDVSNFDFKWKPNPKDPLLIHQFGTQHQKTGGPRYVVEGATEVKYVTTQTVKALPDKKKFKILDNLVIKDFDYSWHPDDTDEPYIYVFGNNQYPAEIMPTIEYVVEGATQIKYVHDIKATLDTDNKNWVIPKNINVSTFDFSWKPNPKDPAYIYEFGTQWQKTGGPRYVVEGATEVKYVSTQQTIALPSRKNWSVPAHVDVTNFDFSWHPDDTSPPYIYHFATQWALTGGPVYTCEGATEVKYLEYPSAVALPNKDNWEIPNDIVVDSFDFSWHPYVEDQPYVYVFGTQHQKTGGPKYITPGVIPTSPIKYIDTRILRAQKVSNKRNFAILNNYKIKDFDYSWHPDETDEPYIYVFGNNQYPAEIMPTVEYAMPGAKQTKYINDIKAVLDVDMTHWQIPEGIDTSEFDFSWKPNPKDPPLVYQFGTQHQKTGGPRYVTPGATVVKYVETIKVKALPNETKFVTLNDYKIKDFDYSWHPDATEEPYIYVFGNNQYSAEIMPTIEYRMEGATAVKYVNDIVATLDVDMNNWVIPSDIKVVDCDFSWKPNPKDPAYIYEFGTQWQKTGGIKYVVNGATEPKYLDLFKSTKIANKKNFAVLNNYKIKDFDYSWHPDQTEEPFIYVFGNNQYPAEIMPTLEYAMPGAKQVKYISDIVATLDVDMSNWDVPENVDTTGFDFSWKPNPKDPAYIYEFGTQWQKTGGPRYVVPDASEVKYVTTQHVNALPTKENWTIPSHVDVTHFDFSWHPDDTSPPYIYHFATQWALTGGPIYTVAGATEKKYLEEPSAIALPNKDNWEVPLDVDITDFDFSWHPYVEDQPYIYQFGTQHQKTGGPRYITPGVIPTSPIKYIDTRILKAKKLSNKRNFAVLNNHKIKDFDWSWHPDETDGPYIYVFGNNQYSAEIMPTIEYAMPGAKQIKYVTDVVAILDVDMNNWVIPDGIDTTGFDFSWKPNPKDPAYIYEFGTQHQKTGGPKYIVQGATETKYVSTQQVKILPNKTNFKISPDCVLDLSDFDFSWHPDSSDPPYIYAWGNQWNKAEDKVVLTYTVSGATEFKYMTDVVKSLPNRKNWVIPVDVDVKDFDFSWEPNPHDDPFVYQFGTQWQKTGGPRYVISGLEDRPVKYVDVSKAKKLPNRNNFIILNDYKVKDFDWSWHPDETEEPFIYIFGNSQYPAEIMPTVEYAMPGSKQIKYVNSVIAILDDDRTNWIVPEGIDVSEFDFSWKPNPKDPPYIYQFGTQWQKTGGPRYVVDGAEQVKYVEGSKAKSLTNRRNWVLPKDISIIEFDYSWHPDETEEPYIYVFGTQWQLTAGPKYVVEGATEYKYMDVNFAKAGPTEKNWVVPSDIVLESFDFSWHPHPDDPPYIYQFGTQWQKTGGPKYTTPGAKDIKYVDTLKAKRLPSKSNWFNPFKVDTSKFDYSWHPDDTSPPYIYQFGTLLNRDDGPRYITPNSLGEIIYLPKVETEEEFIEENITQPVVEDTQVNRYHIETTLEDLVNQHPNEVFWAMNKNIDYTSFDFEWRPESLRDMEYVQVFGSPDSEMTHTYFVSANSYLAGNKSFKFINNIKLNEQELSKLFIKPDMFFVDRGNKESQSRFEKLKEKHGNVQKTRFLNSWVDTINRCINRSSTELCWILNSELDYTNFDFSYYPNPWQMKMVHVFGTQWNHWGTTFMVNRETFANDTKYIKVIEHLNNLNFVKDRIATANSVVHDIIYIDHGNFDEATVTNIKNEGKLVVKYDSDYLTTFKTILSKLPEKKEHFVWIVSSVCEYDKFDFTYICDPYAREQLHVFPSDRQKFGDTFFVNVNRLRELVNNMQSLKDYDKINYNQALRTSRLSAPVIVNEFDSHVMGVMQEFDFPYATFVTSDNKDIVAMDDEPMSLWDQESKTVLITSTGGTRIVVPKEAKQYVETQLYDYPYIKTASRLAKSNPLDIVYLSNGEKCAEENYEHLVKITKGLPNRLVRVDGVNGRVQAYHAAAEASNTSWFLTVFAKLKVNAKFDFNWQPDRLQIPKHYMFLARNPVNGLIYGHQGLIAYNKQMTLENDGQGLDFTLDSPHETIELLSGIATFNTDEFSTWRTAFREVIKLKKENSEISLKRLEAWTTKAEGDFAQYSLNGAKDGMAYYDKVKGKLDKLRLSYEWDWLQKEFTKKYKKKA